MPTGVARAGKRAPMRPSVHMGTRQRAEIVAEWNRNLDVIGYDPEDTGYWTPSRISHHLKEAGLPTQRDFAERYGVSTWQMSYIIRGLTTGSPGPADPLRPAQRALLQSLAAGLNQRGHALATSRTPETVCKTMKLLRIQLGARTDAHAVAIAVARGWITVEGA